MKSEVSTFPIVVIFVCACVSEVVLSSYLLCIYIYIHPAESWGVRLWLLCSLNDVTYNRVHCGLMVVCGHLHITLLHYHHNADLPEGIELLKCSSDTFCLDCVSEIRSILSIIFMQYMGLCVFSLPISLMWLWEYLYLILLSSSNRSMPICHCLGSVHETIVCAVCLSIFLISQHWLLR